MKESKMSWDQPRSTEQLYEFISSREAEIFETEA